MRRGYLLIITVSILGISSLSICGCGKKPSVDDRVLARVSNKFITLGDFKKKMSMLPSYYKDAVDRNRKRYLDDTIMEMMFYEEAIRRGLDQDKETKEIINEARKKILIAKLIKTDVEDKIKVEEPEMRQYYEEHKEDFKSPELWRASHILVKTEGEANAIQEDLSKGADFGELAKAKSIDATATRNGDVGYFRQGQVVPDFENACMSLKVGETSPIVHTQFGYHIIRLTDRKEQGIEPYEKAKKKIEAELRRVKRSETFNKMVLELKNKYNVEIEDDANKLLDSMDSQKAVKK